MGKNRSADPRGPEYERLGSNITSLRTAAGLSQAEAARKLGIVQSTYAGWETGTRKIQMSALIQIAKFYNVTVDSLMGLKSLDPKEETFALKESEKNFILTYRKLNNEGKRKLSERADELLDLGYVQKGEEQKMA